VLILVGCPLCVMEATYGRKKVRMATKWDSNTRSAALRHRNLCLHINPRFLGRKYVKFLVDEFATSSLEGRSASLLCFFPHIGTHATHQVSMAGPLNSTALFFLTLLAISTLFLSAYSAACYNPDGTNRNGQNSTSNPAYEPCDNTVAVSMCCAIGPTVVYPDICVPGGLCYNSVTNLYWRESCTDRIWMSPACIKLFLNGTGDTVVTPCDDGSWCYGDGESALACCKGGNGLFIVNGTETIQNPNPTSISSISPTTIIITTTAPSSSSISPTSTTSPSSGLSLGAKIGLGVGIGVGAIAVLVIVGVCVWTRHSRRGGDTHAVYDVTGPAAPQPERRAITAAVSHEARPRPELDTNHSWRPTEVQGDSAWGRHDAELES
jgi:hypothetical protein